MADHESPPEPSFATVLAQLIASRGMSQAETARLLHVWSGDVSRWLSGGGISIKNVRKIADLFEVDRGWLECVAGYDSRPGPADAAEHISAQRQAIRAQLEGWLNAVGPRYEAYFWASLKAHGDSAVDLIRRIQTAVSDGDDTAVSGAVSTPFEHGRSSAGEPKSPLTMDSRPTDDVLAPLIPTANQRLAA